MKLLHKNNTFILECDFSEKDIAKKAGFSFNFKNNVWFTKDPYKALQFSKYADDNLKDKFDQFLRYLDSKVRESEKKESDIIIPKPDNGKDYFPFQKAGIEYGCKYDNILLADEMGLGKSIQAIGIINALRMKNVLIICPNTLKENWNLELEEWLVDDIPIRICNSLEFDMSEGITIINYEAFNQNTTRSSDKYSKPRRGGKYNNTELIIREIKKRKKLDGLILDESHRIKNYSSNTTRNIFKIRKYFKKKILMTGTPILNKPEELWTTIRFLGYQDVFGKTKKTFGYRYCDLKVEDWGWDYSGSSNLDELQLKLRENFMIRRKRKQVLKDLPPKFRKIVLVDIDDAYKKFIDEYEIFITNISKLSTHEDYSKSMISGIKIRNIEEISEVRKIIGQSKILPVYEYTKDILETGNKVVLFGYHTDVLDTYKRKFKKYNPAFITGKVKSGRQAEVEKFQNDDDCRIIILNLEVGSVGLTLTASHNTVFAELDYVPQKMIQAEDRTNRIGATNPSTNHYIFANETIDAMIGKAQIKKQNVFDRVLESNYI